MSPYHSESTNGSPTKIEIIPSKESLRAMTLHKPCPLTTFKCFISISYSWIFASYLSHFLLSIFDSKEYSLARMEHKQWHENLICTSKSYPPLLQETWLAFPVLNTSIHNHEGFFSWNLLGVLLLFYFSGWIQMQQLPL